MADGEKELLIRFHREVLGERTLGWRNDTAAIALRDDLMLVYSIDRPSFIRGRQGGKALRYHGRWSASVIANDIIAAGVRPRGISFDVGMGDLSDDDFFAFGRGVLDVCHVYGMTYDGGNLASGIDIAGVAWGIADPSAIIRRRGARPSSAILVTTDIGVGWARHVWRHMRPGQACPVDLEDYQDRPWVNLAAFESVWALRCIQAGMDLTDGVTEFGYEILEQSNLGVVFEPAGNIDPRVAAVASALGIPAEAFWFEPGYDTPFAHAWCVDVDAVPAVVAATAGKGAAVRVVGHTAAPKTGVCAARTDGERVPLPRYWDDALRERGSVESWLTQIVESFL